MNELIENFDFESKPEKNSETIITVCGPSGAGKTTIAKFIGKELDLEYLSAGQFFRKIAEEKNMTVEELSSKADKSTDLKVDKRTLRKALNQDCVVESRIAAWVLKGYSDLDIYVTANIEERAKRVQESIEERKNEKTTSKLEKTKEKIKKRDRDNRERYKQYYSINTADLDIFDVLLDNSSMSINEQEQKVYDLITKLLDKNCDNNFNS